MERDLLPPPDPLAAVSEAARLAAGHDTDALQRPCPDGSIDVVVFDNGRLAVYHVSADGRSTLRATHPHVWKRRWWRRSVVAGIVVFFLVAPAVYAVFPPLTEAAFGVGLALALGGSFLFGNTTVFDGLKAAGWDREDWDYVAHVEGAAAGTRRQVDAAIALATKHERHAYAHRLPDGTTEVIATSGGRLYRYWVDVNGNEMLVERSERRYRYVAAIAIGALAILLFVVLFVLGAAGVQESTFLILFGAMFLLFFAGAALDVDMRVHRLAQPRDEWLEVTIPNPNAGD